MGISAPSYVASFSLAQGLLKLTVNLFNSCCYLKNRETQFLIYQASKDKTMNILPAA